jgi:tocopherol cyclase
MLETLRTSLHPAWYQGHRRKPPYFEGWYYKIVDRSEQHRYAIIPGVFRGNEKAARHAFLQVLDGMTGQAT